MTTFIKELSDIAKDYSSNCKITVVDDSVILISSEYNKTIPPVIIMTGPKSIENTVLVFVGGIVWNQIDRSDITSFSCLHHSLKPDEYSSRLQTFMGILRQYVIKNKSQIFDIMQHVLSVHSFKIDEHTVVNNNDRSFDIVAEDYMIHVNKESDGLLYQIYSNRVRVFGKRLYNEEFGTMVKNGTVNLPLLSGDLHKKLKPFNELLYLSVLYLSEH